MPTEDLFNKTHFGQTGQVLAPDNISPNLEEAQEARVKDPLWFLARQWQSGEFDAENGGRVAHTEVIHNHQRVRQLDPGGAGFSTVDAGVPLDVLAEAEDDEGLSSAWNSAAQEYRFRVSVGPTSARTVLNADDYSGRNLDWFHFDVESRGATTPDTGTRKRTRVVPTQLAFKGMPHPRWWRFEDAQVRLEAKTDPDPNALSMLLPEFLVADSNNWLLIPVEQEVGGLRRIESITAIDSFGVATRIDPGCDADDSWQCFTLDRRDAEGSLSGDHLYVPNVAGEVVQGEILEDVSLLRDEDANFVWGVEHWYWDAEAQQRIYRGDRTDRAERASANASQTAETGSETPAHARTYHLKSEVADHWVPYVPRRLNPDSEVDGQTYLRRARSVEWADRDNPQYRTQLLSEAWKLHEEEIPLRGLRVQRLYRFARDHRGEGHIWVARRKDVAPMDGWSGLEFDYVTKES